MKSMMKRAAALLLIPAASLLSSGRSAQAEQPLKVEVTMMTFDMAMYNLYRGSRGGERDYVASIIQNCSDKHIMIKRYEFAGLQVGPQKSLEYVLLSAGRNAKTKTYTSNVYAGYISPQGEGAHGEHDAQVAQNVSGAPAINDICTAGGVIKAVRPDMAEKLYHLLDPYVSQLTHR